MQCGVTALLRRVGTANSTLRTRLALACALLYPTGHVALAQEGAVYEDEIEKRRKQLFGPGGELEKPYVPPDPYKTRKPKPKKKTGGDPFKKWMPLPRPSGYQFKADAGFTGRDMQWWSDARVPSYGDINQVQETLLSFPPPPAPPPVTSISQVWQANPPPNTAPLYDPLLQFVANGPGPNGVGTLGNTVTVAHLQSVTPSVLALAPLLRQLQSGSITLNQLLNSSQAVSFLGIAQNILQPLGLWNFNSLNAWVSYLTPFSRQQQLLNIVLTLEQGILAALNLPPGQFVNVTTTTQAPAVNPFEVVSEIVGLWDSGDRLLFAERFPGLAHQLSKHLGFDVPQGVLYGARTGGKDVWPYQVGITTERRRGNRRDIYVFNQDGFFINETASGVGRFYQGPNDLTLSYMPFEINDGKVDILDSRASHDYILYKRAVGGNANLLNRASTEVTSLIHFDAPLLDDHVHLRIFGGTTPYAVTGGGALRIDYGGKYFSGHIGGMLGYRDTYFDGDHDDFIGYIESESIARTPYIGIDGDDGERGMRLWGQATFMAAGMATRPVGEIDNGASRHWMLQGDLRLIPEIRTEVATPHALFSFGGGFTMGLVPGGDVDLTNPERTLSLYPIRSHVDFICKIRLHDLITDLGPMFFEFGMVSEFSSLLDAHRFGMRLTNSLFFLDYLIEAEEYHGSSFTDVRTGGSIGFWGFNLTYLQSLKDGDYRLQASLDIGALLSGEMILPNRGLLDSYER